MDVKQIEYIVKIAEEHSITRAAEKLFITQSALNQQLLRLEKDLCAPLFYRSKMDMQPTPVGQVYLEYAREILRLKQKAYNIISDMAQTQKGHLSMGFTPGRGIDMFTHIYPTFHQAYPDVTIEPKELSVHRQQQMIARGDLDIGFLTLNSRQRTSDEYILLGSEEIVMAVPSIHPVCQYAAPEGEPFAVLDISKLRHEPFVLMYKESTIRSTIDEIFRTSGFVPNILFETSSNSAIISMIQARLCCGVVPYLYVKNHPKDICCFSFENHPAWDIVACYRKDAYLSHAGRYLIDLVRDFWFG